MRPKPPEHDGGDEQVERGVPRGLPQPQGVVGNAQVVRGCVGSRPRQFAVRQQPHVLRPAPEQERGGDGGDDEDHDARAERCLTPAVQSRDEGDEQRYERRPGGETEPGVGGRTSALDDEPVRHDDRGSDGKDASVHAPREDLQRVQVPELRHEVHEDECDADERVSERERPARAEPVHHRPGRQRHPASNQPAEADRPGELRDRPTELGGDGPQEDAEDGKGLRARAETAHRSDDDDDPSVEEAGLARRFVSAIQMTLPAGGARMIALPDP